MKNYEKEWHKAQTDLVAWLTRNDVPAYLAGHTAPFDIYTNKGMRIEVKASAFREVKQDSWGWFFNIHRHGVVNNDNVDAYILVCLPDQMLEIVGLRSIIRLIVPAPITELTISISLRSLLLYWGGTVDNFDFLRYDGPVGFEAARAQAKNKVTDSQFSS